jgi:hypothetical protein
MKGIRSPLWVALIPAALSVLFTLSMVVISFIYRVAVADEILQLKQRVQMLENAQSSDGRAIAEIQANVRHAADDLRRIDEFVLGRLRRGP